MKRILLVVLAMTLWFFIPQISASPGDTIVVQTIDFNTPVNPGWGAPREGWYEFPPAGSSFQKILMYYTLKCDASQSPACGEWDYLTYTFLYQHTDVYDSTLYFHPNYDVFGNAPDTLDFMNSQSWKYLPLWDYSNQTAPLKTYTLGQGAGSQQFPQTGNANDGKTIFLFKVSELQALLITAGNMTGMKIYINSGNEVFSKFTLRLANTSINGMTSSAIPFKDFTTVFSRSSLTINQPGWFYIPFSFPFHWDGISNLAVDLSYENHSGNTLQLASDDVGFSATAFSGDHENVLNFENWDHVELPVSPFSAINNEVTISCWIYGSPTQPQNDHLFEGLNSAGNRVVNVHLPWSDSRVYWDAGWANGGYDRIDELALPENFKNRWNHWAFTKNAVTGSMKMYLNGQLWFQGTAKNKPMNGITKFTVGSRGTLGNDGYYAGMIDDFCVWNVELSEMMIRDWMFRDINDTHPNFQNLVAYYKFNENEGLQTTDFSPNNLTAELIGSPQWTNYEGNGRVKNFSFSAVRPKFIIEKGPYQAANLDSTLVIDTIPKDVMMVVMYEDVLDPTLPTDTIYKWPSYYNNYVFDENGVAVDSTLVTPDGTIYRVDNPYYGVPFEIVNRFELGRYITPYGNGLSLGTGWTWVFDVTDYASLLHDSVHLTAGNFQELLDLKFMMIEGTPTRDVLSIQNIYTDVHGYANEEQHNLPPKTVFVPEQAAGARLKIRNTGHGFGGTSNCSEFCPRTNKILVNGEEKYTQYLWRNTCGQNPLFPQGGTWLFDRAEWCPGAEVKTWDFEITPWITPGDSVTLDYDLEPGYVWNGQGSWPYYFIESQFITYGAPNYAVDAEISDIVSPNSRHFYNRVNPVCSNPKIQVRNNGTTPVNSLRVSYGPVGGTMITFDWNGNLGFTESTEITLDPIDWGGWLSGNNKFVATITSINGSPDENTSNNSLTVPFEISPEWPNMFIFNLKTNHVAYQTHWEITDIEGTVLYQNGSLTNNTEYADTIELEQGCYNLRINDQGGDGLKFWYNMPPYGNGTAGWAKIYGLNNNLLFNFQADFGDYIQQAFSVGMSLDVHQNQDAGYIEVYPNPTSGVFRVSLKLNEAQDIEIRIHDVFGNQIETRHLADVQNDNVGINLGDQKDGFYICSIFTKQGVVTKKILLIKN
jgi:hypothetical protein